MVWCLPCLPLAIGTYGIVTWVDVQYAAEAMIVAKQCTLSSMLAPFSASYLCKVQPPLFIGLHVSRIANHRIVLGQLMILAISPLGESLS